MKRNWFATRTYANQRFTSPPGDGSFDLGMFVERVEFGLSHVSSATVKAQPEGVHFRQNVYAGMRASHEFGVLRVMVLLGAAVALARTHYDIANRPVFTPWLVEPRSAILLGWR